MNVFSITAFALIFAAGPVTATAAPAGGAPAAAVPATVDQSVQSAISADYRSRCAAALNPTDANIDAAFASLAPDFVNVDPTGRRTGRDELIGLAREQMKMLKATTCDHVVDSFSMTDPVTVVAVTRLHVAGNLTQAEGNHAFDLADSAQDTWKNIDGKWWLTQSRDTHVRVTIDGNVVQELGS